MEKRRRKWMKRSDVASTNYRKHILLDISNQFFGSKYEKKITLQLSCNASFCFLQRRPKKCTFSPLERLKITSRFSPFGSCYKPHIRQNRLLLTSCAVYYLLSLFFSVLFSYSSFKTFFLPTSFKWPHSLRAMRTRKRAASAQAQTFSSLSRE